MTNPTHPIHITPVILCGGSGTRLWPLSRKVFPKQFLVISGSTTLFQQAIMRTKDLPATDIVINDLVIVANEEHRFLVLDQLRDLSIISTSLLLEPTGRNTAPALTLAALHATANGEDPVLIVMPSDQSINDNQMFNKALQDSARTAASGSFVILGVQPNKAETGFGYIKRDSDKSFNGDYGVIEFTEKPGLETAKAYIESQEYSWNAGIFVVRASIWLESLRTFRMDIADAAAKAFHLRSFDQQFIRPDHHLYEAIPNESIDCAVIDKCPGSKFFLRMMPLNVGWNDLGSWDAVWVAGAKNGEGNITVGDTILEETANTLVHASHRLVTTVGVKNLVVIETADAVLVANRDKSQSVKEIVARLASKNRDESTLHRKVLRPWGWYDTIDIGDRFKVKRIQVRPGASLSLQRHAKRAEHWVVVKGVAEVTCGDKVITIKENESTYIPLGEKHRLANKSNVMLEIIEVQSGLYLGEDDIERLDDNYGR